MLSDLPDEITPETAAALQTVLAPLGAVTRLELLTGGMFATTYRATLDDGSRVVIKTAPTDVDRLMTYEHDLLRTEAQVYALAADRPDLLMPRILVQDFSRTVMPSDVLVVTHVPGVPVGDAGELGPDAATRLQHDLGAFMGRLHTVRGDRFGYLNPVVGLAADSWPEAFGLMVEAILADAELWGIPVPADEIRAALVRHADALAEVTVPALVHTDLWPGNLFIEPGSGALVGVIDTERSVWGDPVLELAGADAWGRGHPPADLVAGYTSAAGSCAVTSPSGHGRLSLYRMYLNLVMTVEVGPRAYTGDWVAGYRDGTRAALHDALAELR